MALRVNQLIGFGGRVRDLTRTKLLCHFDGPDASTNIVDSSGFGHILTPAGDAQIDTAQSVFGGASLLLDGTDLVTVPAHAAWDLTGKDVCVEARIRFTSWPASTTAHIIIGASDGSSNHWIFYVYSDGKIAAGANGVNEFTSAAGVIALNTWYAVRIERKNSTGRSDIYVNGTSVVNSTTTWVTDGSGQTLRIGASATDGTRGCAGNIDELRLSHVLRDGANYTPATTPFPF